jgi:hypothetical protein
MTGETLGCPDRAAEPACGLEFRLADAMILLAGLALALAAGAHILVLLAAEAGRFYAAAATHREDLLSNGSSFWRATHDHLRNTLWYGFQAAEAFLLGMTPAFLVLRVKQPRPALRVILGYSGTAAALAILFGLFWVMGLLVLWFPDRFRSETAAGIAVGGTVAVVWGVMALCRRWVAEPSWVDRVGRVLGVTAIATALVGLVISRI